MKKSIRILSILMAFAMLIGSFSVMGSAYQAYKGSDIAGQYNDVDSPEFTLEQYASMALDEVDRMLAKEQMNLDLLGMLTLDLTSIDAALASVLGFLETGGTIIDLLGDASTLSAICEPLQGVSRAAKTDVEVIYALLDFVSNLKGIARNYVIGTIDVGILNGFIEDYKFNVRELVLGFIFGMTEEGKAMDYDFMDEEKGGVDKIPAKYRDNYTGAITLAQTLLNEAVLGEWTMVDEIITDKYSVVMPSSYNWVDAAGNSVVDEAINTAAYDYYAWVHPDDWVTVGLGGAVRVAQGAAAPAPNAGSADITGDKKGYEFIEELMQQAYNYLLVPVLNRDTVDWVLEMSGYTFDETKTQRTVWQALVDENGDPVIDKTTGEQAWGWVNNPTYDPTYHGDAPATEDGYTEISKLFNLDVISKGNVVPKITVPANTTLVDYFNNILGQLVEIIATNNTVVDGTTCSWTWNYEGGNGALFDNIVSLGKYVLQLTGDLFFSDRATPPSAAEIDEMDGQQVIAFIMREILNNSVDYIYVSDEYNTIVDVAYRAVEQLAWQDIPQYTYTKPDAADYPNDAEGYYAAVVDKMLDILFDIAVYNLNQGFDMNVADGKNPLTDTGLLQYQGDDGSYKNNLVQIASWAIRTYGDILALDFRCDVEEDQVKNLTVDDVWMDIDTIINALIPIKGEGAWIASEIAGDGSKIVSETFIFDYLLKPIYTLDATNLATIFKRNSEGDFAKKNGVQIIVDILDNVFDLLFPDVFKAQDTLDAVLQNNLLGDMVYDLIGSLCSGEFANSASTEENPVMMDGRGDSIAATALPVVTMILGLSDDQEFEEMEIYIPELISATGGAPSFEVYNGSSGINTGYTDKNGKFAQDALYTYKVVSAEVQSYNTSGEATDALLDRGIEDGTTIAGGDSVTVTLNGELNAGDLIEFKVTYIIMGEDGKPMTANAAGAADEASAVELTKTVYAYVGETDKGDDELEQSIVVGNREILYEEAMYLAGGDDLDDVAGRMIRIQDVNDDGKTTGTASITSISNDKAASYPFVVKSADADFTSQALEGKGGLYYLYPYAMNTYTYTNEDGESVTGEWQRYEDYYAKDEDGNVIVDEETGEPTTIVGNNGGVPNGKYVLSAAVNVDGATNNVSTTVFLYDDYGLESAFNNAVAANRQRTNYNMGAQGGKAEELYTDYIDLLKDIARFVLEPKDKDTFESKIAITDDQKKAGYENKYEVLAEQLADAIEALDEFELNSGIDALKNALADYSGVNYTIVNTAEGPYKKDLEYDDDAYVYFGMRDYVPHTYNRYKDARDRVTSLINSQEIFIPAPFTDVDIYGEDYEPTDEEIGARAEALLAYAEAVENKEVVGAIESLYAQHMLNLTGERLIRMEADTSKLQIVYDMFSGAVVPGTEANYTKASLEKYQRAEAFAKKTLETAVTVNGEPNLRPSQVNQATTELTEAWKKLAEGASYSALDKAIANAKEIVDQTGDPATQEAYTAESYEALYNAYVNACEVDRDLSDTDENNALLAELAAAINTALEKLEAAGSDEAIFEVTTEDPGIFFDPTYTYSFTPIISSDKSDYYAMTTPDGNMVDGLIYGIGVNIFDSDIESVFSILENCSLTITLPDSGTATTGTIVEVYHDDGTLLATYYCILRGDATMDGFIDESDAGIIKRQANYMDDYEWSGSEQYVAAASDANEDGMIDESDFDMVKASAGGAFVIDQVTGAELY